MGLLEIDVEESDKEYWENGKGNKIAKRALVIYLGLAEKTVLKELIGLGYYVGSSNLSEIREEIKIKLYQLGLGYIVENRKKENEMNFRKN